MQQPKFNIFQYEDYREILLTLIQNRKKQGLPFSYRWFSQRAGFTSPNILNLVVKGKRHLSMESADRVIEIFHLKKDEALFFKKLIEFQKAKSLSEKELYARELIQIKKYQNQFPLSKEQMEYYSEWYNIPIRELFTLVDAPNSAEEISARLIPGISKVEADRALSKLLNLGFIQKAGSKIRLQTESLTTGSKFANFGVVSFHKKMMQLASEALDRFRAEEREISSVSIGLSQEKFEMAKKMIEDLRDQLMLLSEEDKNKNVIYQINFQLFPISKKKDK